MVVDGHGHSSTYQAHTTLLNLSDRLGPGAPRRGWHRDDHYNSQGTS
jgi:hypothetical protein